jgi:hypothetical protein
MLSFDCHAAGTYDPILPGEVSFLKSDGDWILVPLRLRSGKQFTAMLDTGSPRTILDESLNPDLGKPVGKTTVFFPGAKPMRASVFKAELFLGDVPLQAGRRVVTARRDGKAILGLDCLRHYCIQLDFAARKLRFLDPENLRTEDLGRAFPLHLASWTGHASFRQDFMGNKGVNWLIDTGGSGVDALLNPKLFKVLLHNYSLSPAQMAVNGQATRGVILPEFTFFCERHADVVFGELRSDIWAGAPNVLALRFLARHRVTLDFPKRMMFLRSTDKESSP